MIVVARGRGWDHSRGHGGANWSPPRLASSLYAWYRGDLGITLGTGVSIWQDQTAAARNVSQATGAKQPGYTASGFGGKPELTFSGAPQYLDCAVGVFGTLAQPTTIIVVGRTAQTHANETFVDNPTGGASRQIVCTNSTNQLAMYGGTGFVGAVSAVTTTSIIAAQFNGASSKLFKNDSQTAIATGNPGTTSLVGLEVGAGGAGLSPLFGAISEIIICSAILSAADMASAFRYAAVRYGTNWA